MRLDIAYRNPGELRVNPANARVHSDRQIDKIARSIQSFGFNSPAVIDRNDQLVCGHGRVAAALKLGLKTIPTICVTHLSEAQLRAYAIADNRLADLSEFDTEILGQELEALIDLDIEGFEISDTGFELAEVDQLINDLHEPDEDDAADAQLLASEIVPVARAGDLWQLGEHRLFCGDALDPLSYRIVMGGEKAQMVFTDPPYNVPIAGHVSGLGRARHGEFVQASGEMSPAEFRDFLAGAFRQLVGFSEDGSIHYICMDWRHLRELLEAGDSAYSELKNMVVWNKQTGGMGSLYRSQHEMVVVYKAGKAPHINNVELGKNGRNRTNVWSYRGMSGFQKDRGAKLAAHPTMKPVGLVADAMLDCSKPGGIILDAFGGSGTTLIAAQRARRRARVIELDPHYVDVALHRFRKVTGIEPLHLWTGTSLGPPGRARRAA